MLLDAALLLAVLILALLVGYLPRRAAGLGLAPETITPPTGQ